MMTREEAIALFEKQLTAAQVVLDSGFGSNPGENNSLYRRRKEMAEIALTALRPVSREQVKRLTEEGVLLNCPFCGGEAMVEYDTTEPFEYAVFCGDCGVMPTTSEDEQLARLAWNTRAPILSSREMEMLEGME